MREWLYARKQGPPTTRAEKLYLTLALPLIFGTQLVLDLVGVAPELVVPGSALAKSIAINAWAIRRRIQRAARRAV